MDLEKVEELREGIRQCTSHAQIIACRIRKQQHATPQRTITQDHQQEHQDAPT